MTQPITAVQQNFRNVSSSIWTLIFPFQPYNGGEGVSLACGTTTNRVQLLGDFGSRANENVNIAVIYNYGAVPAFVRFGDVTVVALTSSMAVPPGAALTCTIPGATTETSPVYLAGITASSTATLQIITGFGN